MLMHDLIGYFLIAVILLLTGLFTIFAIDMFFGNPLYFKMKKAYWNIIERLGR